MKRHRNKVAIIEPSRIVYEGLSNLLLKSQHHFSVYKVDDFDELKHLSTTLDINIMIINPTLVINKLNDFTKLKNEMGSTICVGLLYAYFEEEILNQFDTLIAINDSNDVIIDKLIKSKETSSHSYENSEALSERETDVLIELINGLSNKEVGEKLNISIHTVITHRKNIMEKTGIKSLSGLTIYAITKNIIKIN